jgi:hypothetical protein
MRAMKAGLRGGDSLPDGHCAVASVASIVFAQVIVKNCDTAAAGAVIRLIQEFELRIQDNVRWATGL